MSEFIASQKGGLDFKQHTQILVDGQLYLINLIIAGNAGYFVSSSPSPRGLITIGGGFNHRLKALIIRFLAP